MTTLDAADEAAESAPPAATELTAAAARRIALAAQGFGRPRPTGTVTARHIAAAVDTMGLLQLDSVNVLCRSHYLPVFSRVGAYPQATLDRLTAHTAGPINRRYVEYWAHEASLIPLATWPLMRWRMDRAIEDSWGGMRALAAEKPEMLDEVRQAVADRGPIRSSELGYERAAKRPGAMWNWHEGKVALEFLFWRGEVAAERRINFERRYDLASRVLPPEYTEGPGPSRADAQRELIRIAARAYGIATEPDLGDYFRVPRTESKLRVAELVESGELIPVTVRGWNAPAYLWPTARRPRRITGRALLSPFDPLVWFRPRALRLFDFHYRIEIYTPAAQRRHGYYVLPFLLDDALVGRVDLKADRQAGLLRVQSAWAETGVDHARVGTELAAELKTMASWLGLDGVAVAGPGDLAPALAACLDIG